MSFRRPGNPGDAAEEVRSWFDRWDGGGPGVRPWAAEAVARLPGRDRPAALLAGAAPYRITHQQVAAFRADQPGDADLVRLLAWGAMLAVRRIEAWIVPGDLVGPG